jgi:hypothetical protein
MLKLNIFFVVFVCLISFSLQDYSPSCYQAQKIFTNNSYHAAQLVYTNYVTTCMKALNVNNTKVTCQDSGNTTIFKDFCTSSIYVNSTTSYTGKLCTLTASGNKLSPYQNVTYTLVMYVCLPLACSQNNSDIKQYQSDWSTSLSEISTLGWNKTSINATIKCGSFPAWAIIIIILAIIAVAVIIIVLVVVMLRRRTQYQNI